MFVNADQKVFEEEIQKSLEDVKENCLPKRN